jgi:hypothetical protein
MSDLSFSPNDDLLIYPGREAMEALLQEAENGNESAQWLHDAFLSWFVKWTDGSTPHCVDCDQPMSNFAMFTMVFIGKAALISVFCENCMNKHESRYSIAEVIERRSKLPRYAKAIASASFDLPPLPDGEA